MNNRNETIFKRMANGESAAALANEYNISKVRVHQIFKNEQKKQALDNDPLHQIIRKAAEELGYDSLMAGRVIGNLRSRGHVTTVEELKQLDLNWWKDMYETGPVHIKIIEKALASN